MSANQKIILAIFIVYLALNAAIGIIFSNRQNKKQHTSSEKKFFIGGRNMNGLLLAMTTMATYTSVSSFISGPGAAGLTYGYAQAWIATVQVPITFLVLGVLGNKLALVSRRTGAVTVVGYLKARYKSFSYCNQLTYGCLLHGTDDRTVYWRSNSDFFYHRT